MTEREPALYVRRRCRFCNGSRRRLNGRWILWKRRRLGLSRSELATQVGLTTSGLEKIEYGRSGVPERLALRFDLHVNAVAVSNPKYRRTKRGVA